MTKYITFNVLDMESESEILLRSGAKFKVVKVSRHIPSEEKLKNAFGNELADHEPLKDETKDKKEIDKEVDNTKEEKEGNKEVGSEKESKKNAKTKSEITYVYL